MYGTSIEAYTAVQSLIDGGVAPALITFVKPHPPTFFKNPAIEDKFQRSLEASGVVLMSGYTLCEVQERGVSLEEREGENIFIKCQVHTHTHTCIQAIVDVKHVSYY